MSTIKVRKQNNKSSKFGAYVVITQVPNQKLINNPIFIFKSLSSKASRYFFFVFLSPLSSPSFMGFMS
jgi:hypothetical protein